jgi:hypothetical protein
VIILVKDLPFKKAKKLVAFTNPKENNFIPEILHFFKANQLFIKANLEIIAQHKI